MSNLIPTKDEVYAIDMMAKHAVSSSLCKDKGDYSNMFAIGMYARELGLPVMQCLFGGMTIINSRITLSAQIMSLMIRQKGHKIEQVKSDDEICTLKGIRTDTGQEMEVSFSVEDAKKAQLTGKDNWKKYPADMCFARALSRLARRLFSDVIGSSYVEGEIQEEEPKTINIPVEQPKQSLTDEQVHELFSEKTADMNQIDLGLVMSGYLFENGGNSLEFKKKWLENPGRGMKYFLENLARFKEASDLPST